MKRVMCWKIIGRFKEAFLRSPARIERKGVGRGNSCTVPGVGMSSASSKSRKRAMVGVDVDCRGKEKWYLSPAGHGRLIRLTNEIGVYVLHLDIYPISFNSVVR